MHPHPHTYAFRSRVAPVPRNDAAAVAGAIACVLGAAILYLCFMALALVDDDTNVVLGRVESPIAIAALHSDSASRWRRG